VRILAIAAMCLFLLGSIVPSLAQEDEAPPGVVVELVPLGTADEPIASEEEIPVADPAPVEPPQVVVAPEPIASPTLTPSPTAVPPSGPGTVLLADNFEDLTRPNFPLTTTDPSEESRGYIDGQYEIRNGLRDFDSRGAAVPGQFADTTIAIDARVYGGPANRIVHVGCRRSLTAGQETGYVFGIRPEIGRFLLARAQPSGSLTPLVDQPSTAINRADAFNRLELTCSGSTITAAVNGVTVATVQDTTFTSGALRFGVGGSGATARFDNLVVTQR
jgi:hypothetical protein